MTHIEIRIRGIYSDLSKSEKRVADYLLSDLNRVFVTPISALAEESGVSQVAWVRFCKSIGFSGLKELKRNLFEALNESSQDEPDKEQIYADIKNCPSAEAMVQTVKSSSIQAIEDTVKLIDYEAIDKAAQIIIQADSVKLFGVGASALVAEDLHNKLIRIGINVCFCRDTHIQLTYASNIGENDVAVFFSNSGHTSEVIEVLLTTKKSGCKNIGITRFGKSPLSSDADILLYTSSPEVYRRSGAMSSRIAQLVLVDILFTAIASRDYERVEAKLENSFDICYKHKL